jgi:hypothetical protein
MQTTDLAASNSLADLAARVRAEHEGVARAMKRGLEHAIAAGKLLLEAKAQLAHGQWLPWLHQLCPALPERTAQLYMRLARHAPELEAKSASVADLTVTGAIELLAPPPSEPDWDDWDSTREWVDRQLDGPFNDRDFPEGDVSYDWVETKLRHQAGLPWTVDWCFSVADSTKDGRPAMRLCPWDDLLAAYGALVPFVTGDRALKFDFASIRSMQNAIGLVECEAMWMLGGILNEIEYRQKIDDERYEREWEETHSAVMARIEQQLAEVRS